jgi:hypothetical protein
MSVLQCSNIHFESTANNRIQLGSSNTFSFIAGGVTAATVNSTALSVSTLALTNSFSIATANVASQTLTDGATISWNTASGQIATVTLGGNRTFLGPTNLKIGTYVLNVIQDGTGSRTGDFSNTVFKFPGGVKPTLTTTANARDIIFFYSDGTNMYGSFLPDVK